jgi:hypothetical protein
MPDTPAIVSTGPRRGRRARLLLIPVRSLMPLLTIVIIAGTILWGPWVSLALAVALHFIAERIL